MSLLKFKFSEMDTRLVRHGSRVFKFKIQYHSEKSRLPCSDETAQKEVEQIIKVIFMDPDALQPLKTDHFLAFPYKLQWKTARKLEFYHREQKLNAHPNVFNIYLLDRDDNDDSISERRAEAAETDHQRIPVQDTSEQNVETTPMRDESHPASKTRKTLPSNSDKVKSQRKRTEAVVKQYALRSKLHGTANTSEDEPSSKRPKRILQSSTSVKEKTTEQTDRSPEAGTEANSFSPAEPEGGIDLPSRRPDRDTIQQDQLEELMRLQNLARPTRQTTDLSEQSVQQESRGMLGSVWNDIVLHFSQLQTLCACRGYVAIKLIWV
ncbi:membrane-anchored junction protein-like isoform X1 [Ptychodera flava]|uniref:membrane-anchored junction protein-like isoform X1 n=1 Tax=Ptychodera flava TaxID=63121 RepID=UPI003969F31B